MDSALQTTVDTTLSYFMTQFFLGTPGTLNNGNNGAAFIFDWPVKLGYAGACLAFFLSIAGTYTAGKNIVSELEISFFSFLEDFQDNDGYIALMDDEVQNQQFSDYLTFQAIDTFVMMATIFLHCGYLLGMGFAVALLIFMQIKSYKTSVGNGDIPIDKAWKLLLFGVLFGSLDYVAGWAVTIRKVTILEMVGFHAHTATKTTTEAKTMTTA